MADDFEQRVRERAHKIWEQEGRPHGRDAEHWEKARTLVAIEMEPEGAAQLPNPMTDPNADPAREEPVEPIEALENQGEFPDRFADQGEKSSGPVRRRRDNTAQRQAEAPVSVPAEQQHPPAKLTGRRKKPG